jgi:hypothetical protein
MRYLPLSLLLLAACTDGIDSKNHDNVAPSMATALIGPTSPDASSELTCEGIGYDDPNGDADQSRFVWTRNGEEIGTTEVLTTLIARGDEITCTITPSDGELDGPTVSATVTVGNALPTIGDVAISPSGATANTPLTCALASYNDADGDPNSSTITWEIDGIGAGTGATLTEGYVRDNVVTCTIVPSDGVDQLAPVSAYVTIGNAPPVIGDVTITPEVATLSETLTCSATDVTDPDGDPITISYAWSVIGSVVSTDSATLASAFVGGDNVSCAAYASDGLDDTTVTSEDLVIANTPPATPGASVVPDLPDGADDLQCVLDTPSIDPDGDAISYSITWTADGALYPDDVPGAAGPASLVFQDDVVPASDTTLADTWTCILTASDGVDASAPGEATVDILPPARTLGVTSQSDDSALLSTSFMVGQAFTVPADGYLDALGLWAIDVSPPNARLALYTDDGGLPADLVAESGAPAQLYGGINTLPIDGGRVPIDAGTYWLFMSFDGVATISKATSGAVTTTYTSHDANQPSPAFLTDVLSYSSTPYDLFLVVR